MSNSKDNEESVAEVTAFNENEDVSAIGDEIESFSTSERLISPLEEEVINALNKKGISFQEMSVSYVTFKRTGRDLPFPEEVRLPRGCLSNLSEQLSWKTTSHPTYRGYVAPSIGFAELLFRGGRRYSDQFIPVRIADFSTDLQISCDHQNYEDLKAVSFTLKKNLTLGGTHDGVIENPRLHFSGTDGRPCIEVSNASPLAVAFHASGSMSLKRQPFVGSIKLFFGRPVSEEDAISAVEKLSSSLLYELDVRNNVLLSLARREPPEGYRISRARRRRRADKVRYPLTRIRPEVAALFNFASSAAGNPPLAFLSYYQALEYFIPAAVRRSAISALKKEFRDPFFDPSNDDSLLRLIGIAERSATSAESAQFRTLIADSVRVDPISSFLANNWGNHFTKKGPIQAVAHLNQDNPRDLLQQVADRIYQIRNRIVHAKDDPKYGDARVLLPESIEADLLWPDVELVRLLATEVVMDLS